MVVGDAIAEYRKVNNISQTEFSNQIPFSRTYLSKIEKGERGWPDSYDQQLAAIHWIFKIILSNLRTNGYIPNILNTNPDQDMHLSDQLLGFHKDIEELEKAARMVMKDRVKDPVENKKNAEKLWFEYRDVLARGMVTMGLLEEKFDMDVDSMIKKHDLEMKKGER